MKQFLNNKTRLIIYVKKIHFQKLCWYMVVPNTLNFIKIESSVFELS